MEDKHLLTATYHLFELQWRAQRYRGNGPWVLYTGRCAGLWSTLSNCGR